MLGVFVCIYSSVCLPLCLLQFFALYFWACVHTCTCMPLYFLFILLHSGLWFIAVYGFSLPESCADPLHLKDFKKHTYKHTHFSVRAALIQNVCWVWLQVPLGGMKNLLSKLFVISKRHHFHLWELQLCLFYAKCMHGKEEDKMVTRNYCLKLLIRK